MENEELKNKVVETYAEDMARVIESDQAGLIKKIIHEQEEKEKEKENSSTDSKYKSLYVGFGVFLLLIALGILFFFSFRKQNNLILPYIQFSPIIFNDKSFFIEINDFSKDRLTQSVLTEVKFSDVKEGGVEGIYFTKSKQIIGLREFLGIIRSNFIYPDNTILSDNFLLGFVKKVDHRDLFIVLKTKSFQDIFAPIRTWENKMFYDLHSFFGVEINTETNYLLTKNFEDSVVLNKNARVLYDKAQSIVLMYVFVNDNTIVLADTKLAVEEIIDRLEGSKLQR